MELMVLYLPIKEVVSMKIDFKIIGQRIKDARKEKGWSQDKLSEEIDVSPVYISRIERGSTQINLNRLVDLANALDTSIEYLLTGAVPHTQNYLNEDLYKTLLACGPAKQRLIYNIAQIVSHAKFV